VAGKVHQHPPVEVPVAPVEASVEAPVEAIESVRSMWPAGEGSQFPVEGKEFLYAIEHYQYLEYSFLRRIVDQLTNQMYIASPQVKAVCDIINNLAIHLKFPKHVQDELAQARFTLTNSPRAVLNKVLDSVLDLAKEVKDFNWPKYEEWTHPFQLTFDLIQEAKIKLGEFDPDDLPVDPDF
jgi:hypothetical protein